MIVLLSVLAAAAEDESSEPDFIRSSRRQKGNLADLRFSYHHHYIIPSDAISNYLDTLVNYPTS